MRLRTAGLLFDIRRAAQDIAEFTHGLTYEAFLADRKSQQAVERSFTIIGEAANRLRRHDPEAAQRISELRQMVGMRNVLVHAYDSVKYEKVWETIQESLPVLHDEVDALLREVTADDDGPGL
jgi:uncharacterized protein with HEPN domain